MINYFVQIDLSVEKTYADIYKIMHKVRRKCKTNENKVELILIIIKKIVFNVCF